MAKHKKLLNNKSIKYIELIKKNYKILYLIFGAVALFVFERVAFHNDFMNKVRTNERSNFTYFVSTLIFFTFCGVYIILTIIGRTLSQDWTGDKLKLTRINKREDIF